MKERFSRVLLVQSASPKGVNSIAHFPPPGLGILSQVMQDNGIECSIFDLNLGYSIHALDNKIAELKPELLGLSMMTPMYKESYTLLSEVKKKHPRLKIVVGGPHVSSFREKVLEECDAIDFGVVMEGEETIVELCRGIDPANIKGLLYRTNSLIKYNGDRNFIDLNKISFPKYDNFEKNKYLTRSIGIITSRGCPYLCTYCCVRFTTGRKFRMKTAANILKELQYFYGQGYREFYFLDDNFTLFPERVLELCDLIENNQLTDLKLSLPNGIRADRTTKQLLARMKEVGFYKLSIGVEAGNDKMLKILKKGEKIDTIKQAIKNSCELGYEVTLYFLFGSPFETEKDIEDSIALAKQYPVHFAEFYNIVPFPNTELFNWLQENNYLLKTPEEYLNDYDYYSGQFYFETPELPMPKRAELFNKVKCESKKIFQRSLERKYVGKFGLAGKFLARMATNRLFLKFFYQNRIFRSIVDFTRTKVA